MRASKLLTAFIFLAFLLATYSLTANEICEEELSKDISFKKLTSFDARSEFPIFSPDGKSVLFLSNFKKEREICFDVWKVSIDGSKPIKLIDFDVQTNPKLADPGIFPKLSFLGNSNDLMIYEAKNLHEIFKINLANIPQYPLIRQQVDGPEKGFELLLKVPAGLMASNIEYSPATGLSAWASFSWTQKLPYKIRIAPFSELNGQETNNYGKVLLEVTDGKINSFSFSPDGKYLAVSAVLEGLQNGVRPDIFLIDVQSGKIIKNLTQTGKAGISNLYPEWSPNGEWISYTSEFKGKKVIYLHNLKTQKLIDLTSSIGNCYAGAWAPDGNSIAFVYENEKNANIVLAENVFHKAVITKPDDEQISNYEQNITNELPRLKIEPNPINDIGTIHYSTNISAPISIKIINSLGEIVAVIENPYTEGGEYIIPLNTTALSSGIYYAVITQGSFVQTEKIMIAK